MHLYHNLGTQVTTNSSCLFEFLTTENGSARGLYAVVLSTCRLTRGKLGRNIAQPLVLLQISVHSFQTLSMDLASRRRTGTADLPPKPEAGLAEWTSRIKELQRQVDADEEAETKRLEEEIAASRLARMRRSTGRGTSVDLCMFPSVYPCAM
jgi:hypothetical protein